MSIRGIGTALLRCESPGCSATLVMSGPIGFFCSKHSPREYPFHSHAPLGPNTAPPCSMCSQRLAVMRFLCEDCTPNPRVEDDPRRSPSKASPGLTQAIALCEAQFDVPGEGAKDMAYVDAKRSFNAGVRACVTALRMEGPSHVNEAERAHLAHAQRVAAESSADLAARDAGAVDSECIASEKLSTMVADASATRCTQTDQYGVVCECCERRITGVAPVDLPNASVATLAEAITEMSKDPCKACGHSIYEMSATLDERDGYRDSLIALVEATRHLGPDSGGGPTRMRAVAALRDMAKLREEINATVAEYAGASPTPCKAKVPA